MSSKSARGTTNTNGANTVIGSVPLRNINDSGFGLGLGTAGNSATGGAATASAEAPSAGDSFKVSTLVTVLFARLPANLRDHIAFRHFYTDELDAGAHALCIKYFTLFVLYFCTVFRLEGRRRHYLEQPTERSGREFAAAHRRARTVFQEVSATYSSILLRYSRHSEIHYTARHAILVKGRTSGKSYTGGFKNMNQMLEVREPTFKFESEDFLFYEYLSAFALQIIKLAFAEDTNMQEKAADQVSEMFRSRSFTFNPQRRRVEVRNLERLLDADSTSLKENTAQIAELLTPHDPRIIVKYANQQRTPFIQTKLPGGTSFMKYQRPKPSGTLKAEPTEIEKQYTIESELSTFPLDHPAMYRIRKWHEQQRERERSASYDGNKKRAPDDVTPEPIAAIFTKKGRSSYSKEVNVTTVDSRPSSRQAAGVILNNQSCDDKDDDTQRDTLGTHTNNKSSFRSLTTNIALDPKGVQGQQQKKPSLSSARTSFVAGGGGLAAAQLLSGKGNAVRTSSTRTLPPIRAASSLDYSEATSVPSPHSGGQKKKKNPNPTDPDSLNRTLNSLEAFTQATQNNSNGGVGNTTLRDGTPLNSTATGMIDYSSAGVGNETPADAPTSVSATSFVGGGFSMNSLTSPKTAQQSETERLELEEREAKFYEIFLLPRLFSTHAATTGVGLGGHLPAAVAGAAAVHRHAVAAAAAANTSKAPPPLPYHHAEPKGPLTTVDYKDALSTVIEAWNSFDLTNEIDNVYQAVANGVVVKDLALPTDIMLSYDEVGVLYVNDKDGTPLKLA